MHNNQELQSLYNRQFARCISTIEQVIVPPEVVRDAFEKYLSFAIKDAYELGIKHSNNQNIIKKYQHKRFD